ncbi:hypothetical protein BO99DRAFT_96074 [Aspergillus violaceofuscus CBS 115571]|uniref:Uncharacterized protein n=1 Tax=Aspergillus violaceofuscus (strain CBS 115571) TaxID=1450538 RepID=A0A2V5HI68_ASPV1|nr:hypothetical protein BO99DRAFT_96074 [Aspergillus violaceofuscus CBS 115571]
MHTGPPHRDTPGREAPTVSPSQITNDPHELQGPRLFTPRIRLFTKSVPVLDHVLSTRVLLEKKLYEPHEMSSLSQAKPPTLARFSGRRIRVQVQSCFGLVHQWTGGSCSLPRLLSSSKHWTVSRLLGSCLDCLRTEGESLYGSKEYWWVAATARRWFAWDLT